MHEFLLVLISLAGVAGLGFIAKAITPLLMIEFGLWVLAGGLLLGIPAGLWYHVVLYRALKRRMPLPSWWWRRPVELHDRLTPVEFAPVRPWFVAGAAGFVLCCVGGIVAIAGLSVGPLSP
ncbi:MAG: hypothetical protein IT389_01110 [Nitrospira sp.]|nr:hypothetical protein [Nitrospira sp.]